MSASPHGSQAGSAWSRSLGCGLTADVAPGGDTQAKDVITVIIRARAIEASQYRVRAGAAALAVAGLLFVLYPALRPFSDEKTLAGAQAFASTGWVVAHVMGMLGFIGVALGLLALHVRLADTRAGRQSFWALVLGWIGAGLTLTYYGAEVYGLRAIGQEALAQHDASMLSLADQVRGAPGEVIFAIGMLILAAAGIVAAVAAWRLGGLQRWGALVVATGLVLYIPQFFAGQPLRVAHGALLAAGCMALAAGLWLGQSGPALRASTPALGPPRVTARTPGSNETRLPA
jgi:uncharacterized membrane protein YhaH (DUF805 family)